MIKLRDYQGKIVSKIVELFKTGLKRVLMVAPTGAGKTIMFTFMAFGAVSKGKRVLVLTDRRELLTQAGGAFAKFGLNFNEIKAVVPYVGAHLLSVAMVETLFRRQETLSGYLRKVDFVIIDEAHKNTFNKLLQIFSSNVFIVGATATPERKGRSDSLSDYYEAMVNEVQVSELIKMGYLATPKYYGVTMEEQLKKVKLTNGEFSERQLEEVYNSSEVFGGLENNLRRLAPKGQTIIFCSSVKVSKMIADKVGAIHIDGTLTESERALRLEKFESDPNGRIVNVGILTTGYDCPTVKNIVLYRATMSLPLYLQMIGRGARIAEGKEGFNILDFGNNVLRFGYWHNDREWSLHKRKPSDKLGAESLKFCPKCEYIMQAHLQECPDCGYIYVKSKKEIREMQLKELPYSEVIAKFNEGITMEEAEEIRLSKGYSLGWLARQFNYDKEKLFEYAKYRKFKNPSGWTRFAVKGRN